MANINLGISGKLAQSGIRFNEFVKHSESEEWKQVVTNSSNVNYVYDPIQNDLYVRLQISPSNTNGNTDTDGRIVGKVKSYDDFIKQAKLCANRGKGYIDIAAEEFMARMATVVLLSPDDSAMTKLPTQTKSIMQKFISAMKKLLLQNLKS